METVDLHEARTDKSFTVYISVNNFVMCHFDVTFSNEGSNSKYIGKNFQLFTSGLPATFKREPCYVLEISSATEC